MIALGSSAHLFARPRRREELRRLFEEALDCPVATVELPGLAEPLLVVRFPGGGALSVEFTDDAEDGDDPRRGTWLELRADDPPAVMGRVLSAGFREVTHPGHAHYFMAPGGQVFTIAPAPG